MPLRASHLLCSVLAACLLGACSPSGDVADTSTSTSSLPATTTTDSQTSTTASTQLPSTTSTSPPASGHLLVVGDWGSGTAPQGAVAGAMQRYADENEVTAILTTGDNFYSDDVDFLMAPYGWVEDTGIDWWITWGNHDVETGSRIDAINESFDDPPRWGVYEWGDVAVIVLDSNQITSPAQATFFLEAMAGEKPTVVVMHHPPYSCSHEEATIDLVNQVVPTLDEDVALVLSGHDHNFQRFESDGVSYVVTGGGGSQLHPIQECPENQPELLAGFKLHHFLALSITTQGHLEIQAIDVNGDVFDSSTVDPG